MAHYTEQVTPVSYTGERTVRINGIPIPYRYVAEDLQVEAADGKTVFDFFTFSYLRSNRTEEELRKRPVIFAFNGGPTSPSTWMHLGFWGPRILVSGEDGLPDQEQAGRLRDNPDSLLDLADLVMVDPVNTGFSRLLDPDYADQCYGDHGDADSVSRFVLAWLKKYHRIASPVYLSGESFGSARASLMAWYLKEQADIRGILHIGPGYSNAQATIRTYKDFLPVAALHWYYTEGKKKELKDWIDEARDFLFREYVPGFYMGSQLPEENRLKLAGKLESFTGLPAAYYLEHALTIDRNDFRKMRLGDRGLKLGSYDGRFTLPAEDEGDAFLHAYEPGMKAGMEHYLKEMGIHPGRVYRGASWEEDPEWDWNFNASPDMIGFYANRMPMDQAVAIAMKEHERMRLFFATGYYDTVATVENTRYSITHTNVPMERVTLKEYPSGHAVYADDAARHQLAVDIREFLLAYA